MCHFDKEIDSYIYKFVKTYINLFIYYNSDFMDKSTFMNVFEAKRVLRDFPNKISAADVVNEFLYIGDQKGNIYSYPFRTSDTEIISKNVNEQTKNLSKSKIDKILCYGVISTILVLTDQKLFVVDTALKRAQQLATKIHDFAINENFVKEGGLYSVCAVSRKKQGFIFYYNPNSKKLEDMKTRFPITDVPNQLGYTNNYIIMAYKKQYEVINIDKAFALKKGPLSSKNPYFKITGPSQVLFFSQDIGIFMDPQFMPRQKDNISIPKPILNISICGSYCFILFENFLQIFSCYDPRKFTLVQELPLNMVRGITQQRPFMYSKQQISFLYQIPYEQQIKVLLDRGRVEDALGLLIQKVGPDEQKIQQLKLNAVWPLIKRMQFEKAKQLIKSINFDIRQILLLYPQMISLEVQSMKGKPQKQMSTMILQYLSEKGSKNKQDENQLKKKSKLFLKEILQIKREQFLEKSMKIKIQFPTSKNSLIKNKFPQATAEQMLEIIDFSLIKWFIEMGMFTNLEEFFLSNPIIYCKKLFVQFQNSFLRANEKLIQYPTLKPRFYAAFDRIQDAFQSWKRIAESQRESLVKMACQQAVKLLTQLEDRKQVYAKLYWILRKQPQIGISFFKMVPINFIQPQEVIKNFQQDKNDNKYLQLYLQIIVIDKNTEIQAYHTKLLLLYIDNLFKLHPKENKDGGKGVEFQAKLTKMRLFLENPVAKYASQPILRKIQKCEWLMQDEIFLYSRQKRHEQALEKYIKKNMSKQAEKYCQSNRDKTLTIYFKKLLTMYKSFQASKNSSALFLKKDIMIFLKKYSSDPQLDPITVLELIPEDWMLNDIEGVGGVYQFLQSAITHTLHQKRTMHSSKHLSQMDLLNVEYNLIQSKKAYLKFTYTKKCVICNNPIADKFFVVYPNANVCHQACVKNKKNTICPITNQDFEKTFKY